MTARYERDRHGLLGSEGALDQARRANLVDAVMRAEATEQGTLSSQLETSRNLDIARKEAEEAEEARFEKAITTDMSRLSELEKSLYAKEKARDKADSVHAAEREAFRRSTTG